MPAYRRPNLRLKCIEEDRLIYQKSRHQGTADKTNNDGNGKGDDESLGTKCKYMHIRDRTTQTRKT